SLCALPFITFAFSLFVTKAFSGRYMSAAALLPAVAGAYLLDKLPARRVVALALIPVIAGTLMNRLSVRPPDLIGDALTAVQRAKPPFPIVVGEGLLYIELMEAAEPATRARLVYLKRPEGAPSPDPTNENEVVRLATFLPDYRVSEQAAFLASTPIFYTLYRPHATVDATRPRGGIVDYLALARLDHSAKHVFIVPGIILAYLLRGLHTATPISSIVLGFAAALCIASANYVINEWLDRDFDKFHPKKSQRAAVRRELRGDVVILEWTALLAAGLFCAFLDSRTMYFAATLFALQGIVYNVTPLRTKDTAYLDVLSESINNPVRLIIGWAMIDPTTVPPGSLILTYWAGGAFLMAAKRLSEYREIVAAQGKALLVRYRASFAAY